MKKCYNFKSLLVILSLAATGSLFGCDDDDSTDTDGSSDTETGTDTGTVTDTGSQNDTATQDDSDALGHFGDPCEVNEDCEEGVCHEFGQLGFACTIECEKAEDCEEGSEGQKCNQQGFCRP